MWFDMFLQQRLLRHEIQLVVKNVLAATAGQHSLPFRRLKVALSREATLGPKAAFANNNFHPLKPPRILGVVICKIKWLPLSCQGIEAIAHAWPIRMMCPKTLGFWGASTRENDWGKKKGRTFDHFSGRDGIICTFQMTGCIVKHEQALRAAICLGHEDVDCTIDLCKGCCCIEIPIAIFSGLEHNMCIFAMWLTRGVEHWKEKKNTPVIVMQTRVATVRFGPVLSGILRTLNQTTGPVQPRHWTVGPDPLNAFRGPVQRSTLSGPWTGH